MVALITVREKSHLIISVFWFVIIKMIDWERLKPPSLCVLTVLCNKKSGSFLKSSFTTAKVHLESYKPMRAIGTNYPAHLVMNSRLYCEWDVKLKVFIMAVKSD